MESRLIIANIRSDRMEEVEKALERMGVERVNVSMVKGFGEYHNYFASNWLGNEVRLEVFTKKDHVEAITSAIIAAARTGAPGDGVVAILPIEELYLVRTGEKATAETFWSRSEQ
ncbi:MAG: P-II family nitrogen regulator [Betaproteobacteria bacterium]|nr:P-II family nitrogen regulator [Betaproteobacteria bacterium]MBI2959728.1 P-II family nitrogen regulator [Betaproteobacteria bacterium]